MARNSVYATATAADSVAVKTPELMPPMMMTIRRMLGMASTKYWNRTLAGRRSEVGYLFFLATTNATTMQARHHRMPGM